MVSKLQRELQEEQAESKDLTNELEEMTQDRYDKCDSIIT